MVNLFLIKGVKGFVILYSFIYFSASMVYGNNLKLGTIDYDIDGNNVKYLERYLHINNKKSFKNEVDLNKYINKKEKLLTRLQLFSSSNITYKIKDNTVKLNVYIKDGWTKYLFPGYSYDSNYGNIYSLTYLDLNFLGNFSKFNFGFAHHRYNTYAYLGLMEMPFIDNRIDLIFLYNYNKNIQRYTEQELIQNYNYNSFESAVAVKYKINNKVIYKIMPKLAFYSGYQVFTEKEIIQKYQTTLKLMNLIQYDNSNWINNFKNGELFFIQIDTDLNFQNMFLRNKFNFGAEIYKKVANLDNFYYISKLKVFYILNGAEDYAGRYLRGIEDVSLWGNKGFIVSFEGNMRFLNWDDLLDIHFNPFMDIGIISKPEKNIDIKDSNYTLGFQFEVYSNFFKGLVPVFMYGINLKNHSEQEFVVYFEIF